jgi:hypothetical protein
MTGYNENINWNHEIPYNGVIGHGINDGLISDKKKLADDYFIEGEFDYLENYTTTRRSKKEVELPEVITSELSVEITTPVLKREVDSDPSQLLALGKTEINVEFNKLPQEAQQDLVAALRKKRNLQALTIILAETV